MRCIRCWDTYEEVAHDSQARTHRSRARPRRRDGRDRDRRRRRRRRREAVGRVDARSGDGGRSAHTGGGTVTETETGDDGAVYSVEIELDDGRQVEVNLDENFDVIGQETDDDGPNDKEGPDEGGSDDD